MHKMYISCLFGDTLFRTTESVWLFLDSISRGTVKVKLFHADYLKVIEKLIGGRIARESGDKKGKKVSKASIRKAKNDNLTQLYIQDISPFGTKPQVL